MSKFFVLLSGMNILCNILFGQINYSLSGSVVDEDKKPLTGANVLLFPYEKGATTDGQGQFIISGLSKGIYIIEISFIGYKPVMDTLMVSTDTTYFAQLSASSLTLQEVLVTDNYAEIRKKEESLNIEIVNRDYLKQNLGGSLMKSLERLPGVSTIDIGSGQSKPVIRGLGFNRVVVVENSIKHEGQQWGSDHGLEIDQYAIDNIEVIKGPASLMYGSDAIGGVIDMNNRMVPVENSIGGTIDLSGKTNNDFLGTSLSLFGRKDWFFADLRATLLSYGDYKVPTDSVDIYSYRAALDENYLRNTAGKEFDLHLMFGIIRRKFQSKFYLSNVTGKSGFFANAHGLEPRDVDTDLHDKSNRDIQNPYHTVDHFKVINTSQYIWNKAKLKSDLGFQQNFRQEWSQYVSHGYMPATFPDTLSFGSDLERQFDKDIFSGNLKFSYEPNNRTQWTIGLNGDFQDNRIDGRSFIIPAFKQLNAGVFLFGKYNVDERNLVQVGLRYDAGILDTQEYYDWFPSPVVIDDDTTYQYLKRADDLHRVFSNFSWSAGYNFNAEKWSFKTNIGKSFRMPIAKEIAANGVNYHHFSYEVGNADLSPEISYQLDAGIEFSSRKIAIGATPFLNYFSNYIYLNPTPEHDRLYGSGNQVYNYTQSEILRYGGEIHAHYQVLTSLQLGIISEYVYSEQLSGEKMGFTLPFSPPPSAILNIKYQKPRVKFIENAYASFDYVLTAAQNNIVPPEETTNGYQVINIGFGGELNVIRQKIILSLQVQNLLNNKYFNHTSYYRLINVPEPGRNLILNISIPVSGKLKKE